MYSTSVLFDFQPQIKWAQVFLIKEVPLYCIISSWACIRKVALFCTLGKMSSAPGTCIYLFFPDKVFLLSYLHLQPRQILQEEQCNYVTGRDPVQCDWEKSGTM